MRTSTTVLTLVALLSMSALAGCAGNAPGTVVTNVATPPTASTLAEFGDAPDGAPTGYAATFAQAGTFPSRIASDGARALDVTQARLGPQATTELDALAQDADDGIVEMVLVLTQIPPPAALTVRVSAPAGSAGGTYHVNALFDQNLDGAWDGAEWVVQNHAVELRAGETQTVALPPFALTQSLRLPDGAWMRLALTKEQAPAGWTGKGAFTAGEIEDHVVVFPRVDGKHPAIAVMKCPESVNFKGEPTAIVPCTLANNAPPGHGDQIRWTLSRLTGGVTIDSLTNVETLAPGDTMPLNFLATKGEPLPSTWAYNAVGIDPPSRVTSEGVEIGHGASEGEIDFVETAKACVLLIAEIETSREHRAGESDAIFWIYVKQHFDWKIQEAMEGARVTGTVDGTPVEATTDAEGRAEIRHTVYQYGEYGLMVQDVEAEGCTLDREASQLEATARVD